MEAVKNQSRLESKGERNRLQNGNTRRKKEKGERDKKHRTASLNRVVQKPEV